MKKKILAFSISIISIMLVLLIVYLIKDQKIMINNIVVSKKNVIGVDISKYQGQVDMKKLKEQNIKFVYIKATEGSSSQDRNFINNWKNAKQQQLLAGAYHFFSYDSSGKTQADNYIKTVGDLKGRLIPVVDVEYYGNKETNPPDKEDVITELKIFLDTLEAQYHVKPMIYTRIDVYKKYLKGEFDDYKKWMTCVYYPLSWSYKDEWYLWQYTHKGKLEGYHGKEKYIDLNVVNKKKSLNDLKL